MSNRFDRTTFESADFLIESTEAPKIKAGGSSSSNILNRFNLSIVKDISLLATRTNILASRASRIEKGCTEQSAALLAALQQVSTRVDAASAYQYVLADLYSTTYVSGGTADISYTFGQATLPVLSTTDLLLQTDVYGEKFISPETTISYSTSSASSISVMSIVDFVVDPDGIEMLKQNQVWVRDKVAGQTKGWVRLKSPLQFRGLTPNVLEIWPFPGLGMILNSVSYRRAGDPEDTWYTVDLTYLSGYLAGKLNPFGPTRIHLPNVAISELVIEMDVSNVEVWGISKLKLYHREYDSVGTLIVKDPYSRTIGNCTLRGKDPSDLSTLAITKVTNRATVTLTTTDSTDTPVITGVIMAV